MPMTEIRIHGRGGQGNVVAANMLAMAAFEVGRHGQAFPSFGAERRGAPVIAFVRVADEPIRRRDQVREPGFLIIQDDALLHVPGVLDGLRPGGGVLVNSGRSPEELDVPEGTNLVVLPAAGLARQHLGRPLPNTALLAGFLALTELFPMESLIQALGHKFKGEVLERNTSLINEAASQVPGGLWKEARHAQSA